jgi:predicted alpha/beta-fold hydrolase
LVGFSLGANVVVKWLGEQQENAVKLGVCGAAVACKFV